MSLLIIACAPILIILIYIYIRDKYEKEPLILLLKSLGLGALIVLPIVFVESWLSGYMDNLGATTAAAYNAFVIAASTEEIFKFSALYLLIWKSREFDERFDGIVYAVFISLGFAAVENVMYVYNYGATTGLIRAITAVPAHALFGIVMGYYFALSKFESESTASNMFKALAIPVLLHGIYDFMLMANHPVLLVLFIPYIIFLWRFGFKKLQFN